MPSLPVYSASSPASTPQCLPQLLQTPSGLALLELQGTIHVPSRAGNGEDRPEPSDDRGDASVVGRLIFPGYSPLMSKDDTTWMKRVYLYVGKHQRLTGEVKKLPKPMGILRKRPKEDEEGPDALEFVEVVQHKIVFSQRPEPVSED